MTRHTSQMPVIALILTMIASTGSADPDRLATLRDGPIDKEAPAERLAATDNRDEKKVRNYPMQPPVIPHKIDGYEVNLRANRCLSCHERTLSGQSGAPMVSVTHFMDRDGNFLAAVSPRRYFCSQCHVPQTDLTPPVESDFQDMSTLVGSGGEG